MTKLGSDEAASVLTADCLGLLPGFFSTDVRESVQALDSLVRLCFAHELTAEDRYLMLGYARRFRHTSVRRCCRVRSTMTMFCRRFANLY